MLPANVRYVPVVTPVLTLSPTAALAQSAPACQYVEGFAALQRLDPADIGTCLDNQSLAANGDAQQLTTSDGAAEYPVWSPDGSQIAYDNLETRPMGNNARSSEAWRIWEMNADGSQQHVVITGSYASQERSQNVAMWRGDELLLASYDGHWVIKIAKDDGTMLSTVSLSLKDDKPSDWR